MTNLFDELYRSHVLRLYHLRFLASGLLLHHDTTPEMTEAPTTFTCFLVAVLSRVPGLAQQ